MAPAPSYYAAMKLEVRRLMHALNNAVAVSTTSARFLVETAPALSKDQADALRDTAASAERTAALLRELQAIIG